VLYSQKFFHCAEVVFLSVSVALDRRGKSGVGGQGQLWLRRRIARSTASDRLLLNHYRLSPPIAVALQLASVVVVRWGNGSGSCGSA
jgi:hypothetical protein